MFSNNFFHNNIVGESEAPSLFQKKKCGYQKSRVLKVFFPDIGKITYASPERRFVRIHIYNCLEKLLQKFAGECQMSDSFKKGVILLCESIFEIRQISHLYGSTLSFLQSTFMVKVRELGEMCRVLCNRHRAKACKF